MSADADGDDELLALVRRIEANERAVDALIHLISGGRTINA